MAQVFLGLGANLGDRKGNIKRALKSLESNGVRIVKVSTLIETDPIGGPSQGKYINAVACGETQFGPDALLDLVKSIEKIMGRDMSAIRNAPRPIDIDILLYNTDVICTQGLIVPHPRMKERDFVMEPLSEIAPEIAKWVRES